MFTLGTLARFQMNGVVTKSRACQYMLQSDRRLAQAILSDMVSLESADRDPGEPVNSTVGVVFFCIDLHVQSGQDFRGFCYPVPCSKLRDILTLTSLRWDI